jgi:uncharacterized protein YceH (UPF0502 family)
MIFRSVDQSASLLEKSRRLPTREHAVNMHAMALILVIITRGAQTREEKTTRASALALE